MPSRLSILWERSLSVFILSAASAFISLSKFASSAAALTSSAAILSVKVDTAFCLCWI